MNEQIKQLAVKAKLEHCVSHVRLEDFADLIVNECVRYLNEDYQRDFNTQWREDLSTGIKQHFGVNE